MYIYKFANGRVEELCKPMNPGLLKIWIKTYGELVEGEE